jgi:uncharacterized membrane protein
VTLARRALGGLAVALGLAALAVLATGGLGIGRWSVTRAEDLVAVLAVVVAARALTRGGARPGRAGLSRRAARLVLVAGVAAYVGLMGFVTVTRHLTFKTHALDLGYYVQVVWQLAHAHAPYVTLPPMHAWGDHLSPVLYLLAPLDRLAPGAVPLLLAQTVILAAGAFAAFGYARHRLAVPGAAAAFAGLYLVNPSLHGMNVRDVHPAAFALPLLVAAAFAFDRGRHAWCALALILTLATREDAAIAVVGFGIWLALARGRWRVGAAVAGLSVLVLAVDVAWLMPSFRGSPYPHLHRYAHLGASLPDILVTLFLRPWRWLSVVFTGPKLLYLAELLAPLGLLPLLAPRALAAALPPLAVNLLSRDPILFSYRSQYQAFVLPFLILAAMEGYRRLAPAPAAAAPAARRGAPRMLGIAYLFSALLTARTVNELTVTRWWIGEDTRRLHALVARVPAGVAVSVNERMVPHLAARPEVYIFPARGAAPADYVLEREPVVAATPPDRFERARYREIGRVGEWVLLTRAP